ncbi:MAG: TonB-dependent receptor plug domain-containing protein, partial [Caulobacteraceae bacterium]
SSVRGYAGAIGNVLIDGAPPSSKSEPLEDTIRRILATSVERIELIRGGAPGIDMHGRSVLVNIVRKTNTARTGLLAAATNIFPDGRAGPAFRMEGSIRQGGRSAEGSLLFYKFVDDGAGEGPRIRTDGTGSLLEQAFQDQTAGGQGVQGRAGGTTPLAGGDLRINTSFKNEDYQFEFVDDLEVSATPRVSARNNDVFHELSGEAGFNYDRKFGPSWGLELVGLQRLKRTELSSAFVVEPFDALFTENADSGESILRSTLKYRMTDKWSFETGGEAAFNFLESAVTYAENGAPVVLPAANVRVEERRGEGFVNATWRATPTLTAEAGVRVETSIISQSGDSNSEQSFVYPKPRVLLTWAPSSENQVRLRVEREVGQLDFGDFVSSTSFSTGTVDAGNPDLHPDQTWVGEVAYERRFWGKGAAVLTYRYKQITDATDRVPVFIDDDGDREPDDLDGDGFGDIFDAPGNIGDATAHELSADLTIPLDRLGISGGLFKTQATWRTSQVTDPTTGETRRLSAVQPFNSEFHFTQDLPRHKINWGVDAFVGHTETYFRLDEIRTIKLGPWVTVFVEYKPEPGLSFTLQANNLLARDLDVIRDVYDGPRGANPLAYHEDKSLNFNPFVYFRVRRTFG